MTSAKPKPTRIPNATTPAVKESKSNRLKDRYKTKDIFLVDPRELFLIPNLNSRRTHTKAFERSLDVLEAQIIAAGEVVEPFTAINRDGKLWITNGHRRKMVIDRLIARGVHIEGVTDKVKVLLEKEKNPTNLDLLWSQVYRNANEPFSPLDNADLVMKFRAEGLDNHQIASQMGYTNVHVENLFLLGAVPEDIKGLIDNEQIMASTVIKAIREYGAEKAVDLARRSALQATEDGKTKVTPRVLKHLAEAEAEAEQAATFTPEVQESEQVDPTTAEPEPALAQEPLHQEQAAPATDPVEETPKPETTPAHMAPPPAAPAAVKPCPQEGQEPPTGEPRPEPAPSIPAVTNLVLLRPLAQPQEQPQEIKGLRQDWTVLGPQSWRYLDAILCAYAKGQDLGSTLDAALEFKAAAFQSRPKGDQD